jgi:DNA-binding SARP family transcriptional activator
VSTIAHPNQHPVSTMKFGVLGPVTAWDGGGHPADLKGPRHRAVLARLIVARGRVVPLGVLIDDLWPVPPRGATGAIRTFVGALRRALEPDRPPRSPSRLLVTQGPGYALAAGPDGVDAWRFERLATAAATAAPARVLELAAGADGLGGWRGPAYAGFEGEPWAAAECARLTETRLGLIERQAEARLALGFAAQAVPDLDAHAADHPWREDAWRLLALALYRSGRQADALAMIRRARSRLSTELGLDPGPRLAALERDILHQAPHLDGPAGDVWAETAAAYQGTAAAFARTRLESAATLAGSLACAGGSQLTDAMSQRLAAIEAAEQLDDADLTARVIGNFDLPGIWPRSDDPVLAARIVAAAMRTLPSLREDHKEALRARVLATIALESRGHTDPWPRQAAAESEAIARRLGDPRLLAFALAGVFMQTCYRPGLASRRDRIGAEILALATRHGLVNFEILGRLIRLQALGGLADFTAADAHATALDHLAGRHERPLVTVFTTGYRAMRAAATGADLPAAERGYREAARLLDGAGMPGVEQGLLPLALLTLRLWHIARTSPLTGTPPLTGTTGATYITRAATAVRAPKVALASVAAGFPADTDWGPYQAWAEPWLDLARGDQAAAGAALLRCPPPPPGLLTEALWALTARAAVALGDRDKAREACAALEPAANEIAGAASGLLTAGPVRDYLAEAAPLLS